MSDIIDGSFRAIMFLPLAHALEASMLQKEPRSMQPTECDQAAAQHATFRARLATLHTACTRRCKEHHLNALPPDDPEPFGWDPPAAPDDPEPFGWDPPPSMACS